MERFAVTGSSSNDNWGKSRSVSTQRRGDTQCLLFRLRRYRRRPAAARFLQSSKNNAASSSRSWVVSSRRASSGRSAGKRASSPATTRNQRISFSPNLPHQQAAPAFDLKMPQQYKPARAIGGDDTAGLIRQQARENNQRRRCKMPRHRRRHLPQRVGENIGQHQIERSVLGELRR